MKLNYKQIFVVLITALLFVGSFVFVHNNSAFYKKDIAKITAATLMEEEIIYDNYENKDERFQQGLQAVLLNGEFKGKEVYLENEYTKSGVYDFKFEKGDEVFIHIDDAKSDDNELTGAIDDVKRDKQLLPFIWLFIFVLVLIGRKQGFFAILSLLLNAIILSYALDLYIHHEKLSLIFVSIVLVILFTVISLLFVNGFNEKTYAAIIATLLGTFLSVLIAYLALQIGDEKGLHYEAMDFLTRPYKMIFLAGLFIGSLGAVMDVAITMSSSVFELYDKNKEIPVSALKKSGIDIGKDIMGTMTNILFFAYISGSIPILILYFKNASPLGFTLSLNLSLEIARALAGGIGIVLTIPVGLYIAIFFVEQKRRKSS